MRSPVNLLADGLADLRLAVISPFLDRQHGTERVIIEQLERLSRKPGLEIHLYAQNVEGLSGVSTFRARQKKVSREQIVWHKIPRLPGPHLFAYVWWFFANQFYRWRDAHFRGLAYDLVYSPGINAWDADAIAVHIVFHEFYRRIREDLKFRDAPVRSWLRLLHRRLYYRLMMVLERRIYRRTPCLSAVSGLVASQLQHYFQRADTLVIRNGVDVSRLSPSSRLAARPAVRERFGLLPGQFTLLLIGNDWKKKGLSILLEALARCHELPLTLLVVGSDDRTPYDAMIRDHNLSDRVVFLDPSPDVLQFYAAADAYVGPSLEDAYGLPIIEAMACGLPVIASSRAGASEIITDRKDGIILLNPRDHCELAQLLRLLCSESGLRERLGGEARVTAQRYTWDCNAAQTWSFLEHAAEKKRASKHVGILLE